MNNKRLGRGLSALLREEVIALATTSETVKIVAIDDILASELQPRKRFELVKIQELASSIASNGLVQPLIVTPDNQGVKKYKLVAGERRWRACKLADIFEVPVIIKNYQDDEILKIALLENIQREELSVIEEAEGYLQLISKFNYTQEELSHKLAKSRSHVANLLRLTSLSQYVKDKVNDNQLTMGHARCLINHQDAEAIADYVIANNLTVRQTENIVKRSGRNKTTTYLTGTKRKSVPTASNQQDDLQILARSLSAKFNVKVTIEDDSLGGKITFHYKDHQQLDTILAKLT